MSFISRLLAALSAAMAGIRGFLGYAWDAIEEAAEPVTSRLPWMRDRVRDVGHVAALGGGYALQGAGLALKAPGAVLGGVGSLLGLILPTAAATPQGVADGAVALDDSGLTPPPLDAPFGRFVQGAAISLRDGDKLAFDRSLPYVSEPVAEWLKAMKREDLLTACELPPSVLERHVQAKTAADRSPLIPPLPSASDRRDEYDADRIAHLLFQAKKIRDRKKAPAARSTRPVFDADADDLDAELGIRSGYAH